MRSRKPQNDEQQCQAGSVEQQLDMCETGTLRGDESIRSNREHPNFNIDMSEEDREGDEMSGDDHSSGLQGGESELKNQPHIQTGLPGDETDHESSRNRKDLAA